MAEENKSGAQSKLGELFIDIGSSGLGTLVKGLNTVSASFLLAKNAATQAIKPIINMSQKGAGTARQLDRVSAVTGLSLKRLHDLRIEAGLNGVSFEDLVGQIKSFQTTLNTIHLKGAGNNAGFALLGLTARDMDPQKPLEALEKIRQRVLQLPADRAAYALRELGLSEDLNWLWQQGNKELDSRLKLSNDNLDNLKQQQEGWDRLKTASGMFTDKLMASLPFINDLLQNSDKWLGDLYDRIKDIYNTTVTFITAVKQLKNEAKNTYQTITSAIPGLGEKHKDRERAYREAQELKRHGQWQGVLLRAQYYAYKNKTGYNKSYREWQKEMGYTPSQYANINKTIDELMNGNKPAQPKPKPASQSKTGTANVGVPRGQLTENHDTNIGKWDLEEIPLAEQKKLGMDKGDIPTNGILNPPPSVSNTNNNKNVNVTINQNIQSTDPQGAGRESARLIGQGFADNDLLERSNMSSL